MSPEYAGDPRKCRQLHATLRGWEVDALKGAASQYGVDLERNTPLWKPTITHNAGFDQFIRLVISGGISAQDIEPVSVDVQDIDNDGPITWGKLNTAFTPEELEIIEDYEPDPDIALHNNRGEARALRQILREFAQEVADK